MIPHSPPIPRAAAVAASSIIFPALLHRRRRCRRLPLPIIITIPTFIKAIPSPRTILLPPLLLPAVTTITTRRRPVIVRVRILPFPCSSTTPILSIRTVPIIILLLTTVTTVVVTITVVSMGMITGDSSIALPLRPLAPHGLFLHPPPIPKRKWTRPMAIHPPLLHLS